jgi:hypothetical protein
MNPPIRPPRPSCLAAVVFASALAVRAEDAVLPVAFPVSRYTAVWEDSPFEREVVKPVVQTVASSFAQGLVLEGLVNDDRRGPVAYVRDTREDRSLVITREPSASDSNPYTIVSANLSRNPEESKVTITDGKETGEIGFAAASLTQAIAAPAPAPAAQPQGRPGQLGDPRAKGGAGTPPGLVAPGGGEAAGGRIPGEVATPNEAPSQPASITPALEKLDGEPRRRRVPLPGGN